MNSSSMTDLISLLLINENLTQVRPLRNATRSKKKNKQTKNDMSHFDTK